MAKSILATITPATITKGDTVSGVRYSKLQGATVETRGKGGKPVSVVRTVMAFGPGNAAVANILRAGKPIKALVVRDGGTFRIVGRAPKKAA
jgi:hypothetical protein